MYLTKEEERMLNSDDETISKCMQILVTLGKFYDAEKLIKITSAHISGVSYENIGEAGLEWLKSLKGNVVVPTTVNPAGMDTLRWREMGIKQEFYEKQLEVLSVFEKLGAKLTLTCTPYYLSEVNVKYEEHIAWAESSAVVYANSLIGARTNRESGISALAAALTGRTPYYGMHIKENRAPTVLVKATGNLSAVGYVVGKNLYKEIPYFVFDRSVTEWELKLLSAALAASGGITMFHAEGITPEWEDFEKPKEKVEVNGSMKPCDHVDLIAIGCPHTSDDELKLILRLLNGRKVKRELWVFTSREVAKRNADIVAKIEELGAKVFCDTCMVVSPATEAFDSVMVNSGKAFEYLPKLRNVEVCFGELKDCIEMATTPP